MPSKNVGLTIRLKNNKKTIFMILPGNTKISVIKKNVFDTLKQIRESSEADDEEDDIDIPVPSYEATTTTTAAAREKKAKVEGSEKATTTLDAAAAESDKDIRIAVNKDGKWSEVSDDKQTLESLGIKENGVLAYAVKEQGFEVIEPLLDE